MRTFTPDEIAAGFELQQLVADYWHDADFNESLKIPDFYTEDCSYVGGPGISYNGREGVRRFYDDVRAKKDPTRVMRHTVTNLRVAVKDKNHGTVDYMIVTYAAAGTPPIEGPTAPSQVTDVHLDCVRKAKGKWEIAKFHGAPIFVGGASMLNKLAKT